MTTYSAKNWINGAFVSSASLGISINPATYERIGEYPDDGGAAAGSAIEAASRAFRSTAWHMMPNCEPKCSTRWLWRSSGTAIY